MRAVLGYQGYCGRVPGVLWQGTMRAVLGYHACCARVPGAGVLC